MSIERLSIQQFLEQRGNHLLLDVRSPAEYAHAHLPGALSLPLFTDEERKIVGTTYKQTSREAAIKIGLVFFGPKMRYMVEQVEALLAQKNGTNPPNDQRPTGNIYLYCWRGGMRSAAVAWLLDLYGFKVHVLSGGYKTFRNWCIQQLELPYKLQLIGGYTGSGKTDLLNALKERGELVINLEALASHKGSAFGNIGLPPQPSPEMFENLLALELQQLKAISEKEAKPIWVEDESQRIGLINLPNSFWSLMRQSPIYFLDIPFEERLQYLVKDYGSLERERMQGAIERISKRLGGLETKNAISLLQSGNITECFRILLRYYDKHYEKGLHNRENLPFLLNKISCSGVDTSNIRFLLQKPSVA
ncbi:MAG: tRNA 2-selenouridine(34) synthase MnmH [Chitinophagaceae bacterium]